MEQKYNDKLIRLLLDRIESLEDELAMKDRENKNLRTEVLNLSKVLVERGIANVQTFN